MNELTNDQGFTLIELLVAVVIALFVMAGTYYAFNFQHRAYITGEEITEMQQNLRAAMLILQRDIRMAGFDPTTNAGATILDATANSITFTLDENVDQTLDADGDGEFDNGEAFTYSLYDSSVDVDTDFDDLGRDPDGRATIYNEDGSLRGGNATNQLIAENIEALEFVYTLADGTRTTTPGELGNIRAIQVWLLARTSREISDMPNAENYNLLLASQTADNGNPINSAVFGTLCGGSACNDNFRRRVATATIKCRNMP